MLKKQNLFNNSACVKILAAKFSITTSSNKSLMRGLANIQISHDEKAIGLRKSQTRNLALQRYNTSFFYLDLKLHKNLFIYFNYM